MIRSREVKTEQGMTNYPFLPSAFCFLLFTFCFLLPPSLSAQDTLSFTYKTYGLEQPADNVIQNAHHLDTFFESLYQLKNGGDRQVNIVHIGDSHIQADYLTQVARRNFQAEFGNAGRGLIVPARVAGTNEPFNFASASKTKWNSKRIVFPAQPLPIGIGGITVQTDQPGAIIDIYMNDLWQDHSFNAVTLFFKKDINSFHFALKDTTERPLGVAGPFTSETFTNFTRVLLSDTVKALRIETVKATPEQNQGTLFGLNFENGKPGVLYHAIGVNGAKYTHYNAAEFFCQQTAVLHPDVFIISLGTNESLDFPFTDKSFYSHVDKLVTSLRKYNPDAKFILVTPPDAFLQKTKENPGIQIIRQHIIDYAVENGLAFWDMYKALGGDQSAKRWRQMELLRTDGVHFTKDAYAYQGDLLYDAILKGYNQYVPNRHP
jgi:lysophospholipase L1-like esterase